MEPTAANKEGWGFPGSSRKAHYFVDSTALCRKWGLYGGPLEPDDKSSPDDCVACRRKLDTRKAREVSL